MMQPWLWLTLRLCFLSEFKSWFHYLILYYNNIRIWYYKVRNLVLSTVVKCVYFSLFPYICHISNDLVSLYYVSNMSVYYWVLFYSNLWGQSSVTSPLPMHKIVTDSNIPLLPPRSFGNGSIKICREGHATHIHPRHVRVFPCSWVGARRWGGTLRPVVCKVSWEV